jgi:hypothetical protein
MWECACDCGNIKTVAGPKLKSGNTKSCGCLNRELLSSRKIHGLSRNRLHNIWCGMKARCLNKRVASYPNYGGRGISICNEWLHDAKVFCEWAFSNGYDDTKSIDRIDVNGNYQPDNCRWASPSEQHRNTRKNHMVTIRGETKCLSDWAHDSGTSVHTAIKRLQRGWSIERAVGIQEHNKEAV